MVVVFRRGKLSMPA